MTKADGNDTITVEFEYDHAGLRTKKTKKVNSVITEVTEYILNGKNVVELIHTAYPENSDPVVNVLHFYYDAQGRAAMVKYNGVMYGYVHDLQGDVIGILDSTGNVAVEYKYDAWGRPLSVTGTLAATLGEINPFRYRGYVFDQETQLYYLRSRYYQPFVSRFMNLDKRIIPKKRPFCLSLQCYCNNRPVQCIDSEGTECSESFPSGCATSFEIYRLDTYEMAAFALWLFNGYNSNTQESPTSKAARNTANNLINIFLASNMITSVCKMAYDLVYGIIEPYSSNKDEQILEFGGLLGLTALALDVQTIESFEVICFFGHYGSEIGVMIETGYGDYLVGPIQIGDPALREIDNILSSYYEYEHGYPRGPITLSEFYASRE